MFLAKDAKLGPYQIISLLGSGGMGEVYSATDTRLKRQVAIKVLPSELAENQDYLKRFLREARVIASLNDPHICTIFDIGQNEGLHYLVMEYLAGETLRSRLRAGSVNVEEAVEIGLQIAQGLKTAHTKGIVHRDLKPENIFLTREQGVKILDFGLARPADISRAHADSELPTNDKMTMSGIVLGTLGYMSPEQAAGQQIDSRSDLFAFGLILYEMLTGHPCFVRRTAPETIAAMLLYEPPSPATFGIYIPDELESLLNKCLQKELENRLQSAAEAVNLLSAIAQTTGKAAVPDLVSVAVFPFRNVGNDPENEYFSDGLTEEIITDLSKISALRVISRISAMRLKDSSKNLKQISRELNVRYILEGSVRKAGTNLRITSQLTDTESDSLLCSEKYSGTLDDVFEIQERVSRAIVDSLRIKLTAKENRELAERPFTNVQAYDAYLRARRKMWSFTKDGVDAAISDLREAIAMSGENVLLLRGIGTALVHYVGFALAPDPKYVKEAEEYAAKIFQIDPTGPHGPAMLGVIAAQHGQIEEWIRQLRKSISIDPNDTECLSLLVSGWFFAGRLNEAEKLLYRLETIDPLWFFVHMLKSYKEYLEARYDLALQHLQKARELSGENPVYAWNRAQILASAGEKEAAIRTILESYADPRADAFSTMAHLLKHALQQEKERAYALTTRDFEAAIWSDLLWTHSVAQAYALLNEYDEAMRWLERSVERGFLNYPFLSNDPLLSNLHSQEHFKSLMERVRLQWEEFPKRIER